MTTYKSIGSTAKTYSLRRLTVGITVNATIRAQGKFPTYGCYNYLDGAPSNMISITLSEKREPFKNENKF